MPGKIVQFDDETWSSVNMLAKDKMMTFQELADEAFRGLLRKHNIPFSLNKALRKSVWADLSTEDPASCADSDSKADLPATNGTDGSNAAEPISPRADFRPLLLQ